MSAVNPVIGDADVRKWCIRYAVFRNQDTEVSEIHCSDNSQLKKREGLGSHMKFLFIGPIFASIGDEDFRC